MPGIYFQPPSDALFLYKQLPHGYSECLNACVWFETLTGQSCIGNTFRPDYNLSEDLIAVLQQAAHQAVADMNAGK